MDQPVARYILTELIQPIPPDRLYKGNDLTLRRTVLIIAIPLLKAVSYAEYKRAIERAAPGFSNPPFLHILDMQEQDGQLDVILNYKPGRPLLHALNESKFTLAQAAGMLHQYGLAWQRASEETPLPAVSLALNNLWLSDEGSLYAINTWASHAEPIPALPAALSLLLVQLLTRNTAIPTSEDSLELELRWSLTAYPPAMVEDVMTVIRGARAGQLSVTAFLTCLRSWLDQPGRGAIPSHPVLETAAATSAQAVKPPAPIVEPAANSYVLDDEQETDAEELPAASKRKLGEFGRKAVWGVSITAASLLVFAGVLMLLISWIDLSPSSNKDKSAGAVQSSSPTPTATAKPSPSASATPTPGTTVASDSPIVQVPRLTGMRQQEAEKSALDSGLRYTYFLEPSDQAAGTVIKQEPLSSEQVSKGTRVTFWVSKGR